MARQTAVGALSLEEFQKIWGTSASLIDGARPPHLPGLAWRFYA